MNECNHQCTERRQLVRALEMIAYNFEFYYAEDLASVLRKAKEMRAIAEEALDDLRNSR